MNRPVTWAPIPGLWATAPLSLGPQGPMFPKPLGSYHWASRLLRLCPLGFWAPNPGPLGHCAPDPWATGPLALCDSGSLYPRPV